MATEENHTTETLQGETHAPAQVPAASHGKDEAVLQSVTNLQESLEAQAAKLDAVERQQQEAAIDFKVSTAISQCLNDCQGNPALIGQAKRLEAALSSSLKTLLWVRRVPNAPAELCENALLCVRFIELNLATLGTAGGKTWPVAIEYYDMVKAALLDKTDPHHREVMDSSLTRALPSILPKARQTAKELAPSREFPPPQGHKRPLPNPSRGRTAYNNNGAGPSSSTAASPSAPGPRRRPNNGGYPQFKEDLERAE